MPKTKSSGHAGMMVHFIESPQGKAELAKHRLTARDLATAISAFQKAEGVHVGTSIGVNEHGFFGSTRESWRPEQPDAFTEPLINIPWVQILELLGRVPEGTTGEFLEGGSNQH